MMRMNRVAALLVGAYLAAIVAANLVITHYGPSYSIVTALVLIGLDLCSRDRLADFWGTKRWARMAVLILAGSAISYALNRHAVLIAEASAIAFAASEFGEAILYYTVRRRPWIERANIAASLGSALDSVLFVAMAFGGFGHGNWQIMVGQFGAKIAGCFLWSLLLGKLRPAQRYPVDVVVAD